MGSRIGVVLCGLALLCCAATGAHAEQMNGGDVELGLRGSFSSYSLTIEGEKWGSGSNQDIYTSVGVFLNSWLEVGGVVAYSRATVDPENFDNESGWAFGGGMQLIANLPNDTIALPFVYIGGGVNTYGGDFNGEENETIFPMVGGGVRAFLGKNVALVADLAYSSFSNSGGNKDWDEDTWQLSLGLSAFLGRD